MISRVLLFPNDRRDIGLAVTRRAVTLLHEAGATPIMSDQFSETACLPGYIRFRSMEAALDEAELIVTLGGDGTILRVAHAAAVRELPILGIHMGRLGFLAELDVDDLPRLVGVLHGQYTLDQRMMLVISLSRQGRIIHEDIALNEALLIGGVSGRFVHLSVTAEDQEIVSFAGDGVILSTPTGSTAYAMAVGGPIIEPSAESILIAPVCAHTLTARPILLAPERTVTIRLRAAKTVYLNVDGKGEFPFRTDDRLIVRRAAYKTRLVRVGTHNFFALLGEKLSV